MKYPLLVPALAGLVVLAEACIVHTHPVGTGRPATRTCPPAHHWNGRACVHNGGGNGNGRGRGDERGHGHGRSHGRGHGHD